MTVVLSDGTRFSATGLGLEPMLDCGLMKIDANSLKGRELSFAEMGWSADLKVNQPCISLGHSGGFNKKRGAVVRFGRIAKVVSQDHGYMQSTCLMEPGDSGGPLFDMNGCVIGIHSRINQELDENYEVPIDLFRIFWKQLTASEKFRASRVKTTLQFGLRLLRGRSHRMGPPEEEEEEQQRRRRGAKIMRLATGGWAAGQKLKKYDRIMKFDGKRIANSGQLQMLLYEAYLLNKSNIEIELMRSDSKITLRLDCSKLKEKDNSGKKLNVMTNYKQVPSSNIAPMPQLAKLPSQFVKLESKLDDNCVRIRSKVGKRNKSVFGTLLSSEIGSLVVSKNSLVGTSPIITLEGQSPVAAKIVARNKEEDLILLRIPSMTSAKFTRGIALTASSESKPSQISNKDHFTPGNFLLSPHPTNSGEVSLLGAKRFSVLGAGFFGVAPGVKNGVVVLNEIIPGGAAEKAGFKPGDIVMSIGNKEVKTPFALSSILSKYAPGETVRVKVVRVDKAITKDVKLQRRPSVESGNRRRGGMHIAEHFDGGKSRVRNGFASVWVHDAHLLPRECGGPVFTTSGAFVGINIARFSRTQSYILPKETLQTFVKSAIGHQASKAKVQP